MRRDSRGILQVMLVSPSRTYGKYTYHAFIRYKAEETGLDVQRQLRREDNQVDRRSKCPLTLDGGRDRDGNMDCEQYVRSPGTGFRTNDYKQLQKAIEHRDRFWSKFALRRNMGRDL